MSEDKKCYHEVGEEALDVDGCCGKCGLAAEYLSKVNCCGHDVDKANKRFGNDLHELIDRYRLEFDMSYAETVGMLEIVKQDIYMELRDEVEDS